MSERECERESERESECESSSSGYDPGVPMDIEVTALQEARPMEVDHNGRTIPQFIYETPPRFQRTTSSPPPLPVTRRTRERASSVDYSSRIRPRKLFESPVAPGRTDVEAPVSNVHGMETAILTPPAQIQQQQPNPKKESKNPWNPCPWCDNCS